MVEQRNDGWVGLGLLVCGFGLQMANEWYKPGGWMLVYGLALLGALAAAYLGVRRRLVDIGAKAVEEARAARRKAANEVG